jgi:lipopolysaccharide/colanic/teichoic acid biosynthesis glycosyltransferase
MELAYLQEKATNTKAYQYFPADSSLAKEMVGKVKNDFFYIGNESYKINRLINAFESGYASDTIENALEILKRSSSRNFTPDIFIIDSKVPEASLREFQQFLSANLQFAMIPLVIDASSLADSALARFRKFSFLDEIIFIKDTPKEKLIAKVEFLKKIKQQEKQILPQSDVQTAAMGVSGLSPVLKRAFDIVITLAALILLSPFFLLIALLIKLESKGPVFYISKRAGKGYNVFNFYKFRTMIIDADQKVGQLSHLNQYSEKDNGPMFFKVSNDPRVTRVGAFLRNTSMDELPQLINVLLGDMSLVGNRPLPLYEAASLTTDDWAARFMAPAGITGLWQIKKRGSKNMSAEERIGLDITYAEKYNFVYDLWIIANTPSALIQKENV